MYIYIYIYIYIYVCICIYICRPIWVDGACRHLVNCARRGGGERGVTVPVVEACAWSSAVGELCSVIIKGGIVEDVDYREIVGW